MKQWSVHFPQKNNQQTATELQLFREVVLYSDETRQKDGRKRKPQAIIVDYVRISMDNITWLPLNIIDIMFAYFTIVTIA